MKITSSVEYSTRLMAALGRAGDGASLSAEKLSESENVPIDYVNQLLLRLKRAGLVSSLRGQGGGYRLAKPTAEIRIGQIVRAIEGKIFESVCEKYESGQRNCHHQSHCGLSSIWYKLGIMIEEYFDNITLAQVLEESSASSCGKLMTDFEQQSAARVQ